jgi:hypothetical protein
MAWATCNDPCRRRPQAISKPARPVQWHPRGDGQAYGGYDTDLSTQENPAVTRRMSIAERFRSHPFRAFRRRPRSLQDRRIDAGYYVAGAGHQQRQWIAAGDRDPDRQRSHADAAEQRAVQPPQRDHRNAEPTRRRSAQPAAAYVWLVSSARRGPTPTTHFYPQDYTLSPISAVVGANLFQNNQHRQLTSNGVQMVTGNWGISDVLRNVAGTPVRLLTEHVIARPDNQDFNIALAGAQPLFVNAADRNYFPAPLSRAIDSGSRRWKTVPRSCWSSGRWVWPIPRCWLPTRDADGPVADRRSRGRAAARPGPERLHRSRFAGPLRLRRPVGTPGVPSRQ